MIRVWIIRANFSISSSAKLDQHTFSFVYFIKTVYFMYGGKSVRQFVSRWFSYAFHII